VKTLTVLSAIAVAVLLGGCAAMEKEIHDADQKQCEGYGFKSGTDPFANCMQKIASDRQKRADAVMAAGAAKPAATATKTDCKTTEKERSKTDGTSASTTTGGIGSSTTTGSSSSTTTSSGFSFTSCVNE